MPTPSNARLEGSGVGTAALDVPEVKFRVMEPSDTGQSFNTHTSEPSPSTGLVRIEPTPLVLLSSKTKASDAGSIAPPTESSPKKTRAEPPLVTGLALQTLWPLMYRHCVAGPIAETDVDAIEPKGVTNEYAPSVS